MMILAQRKHQAVVINLICAAFKQDPQFLAYTQGKPARIRMIAWLAFETCISSKTIFLTEDLNAVALCKPSMSRTFFSRAWLVQFFFPFVFGAIPLLNLIKIESAIEKKRQHAPHGLYIWMLATDPDHQGQSLASRLLDQIHAMMPQTYRDIFLETATLANAQYYAKRGYQQYDEIEINANLRIIYMRLSATFAKK